MAAQAEIKAEEFMKEGEKALHKFSIFSSSSKYEDASDSFEKAANQFKIAKKCKLDIFHVTTPFGEFLRWSYLQGKNQVKPLRNALIVKCA
jgi:hypothetical protein